MQFKITNMYYVQHYPEWVVQVRTPTGELLGMWGFVCHQTAKEFIAWKATA
jgi:hypothetical protein